MPKRIARRKHIPHRTCVGCRDVLEKRSLIRVVRTPHGVYLDLTGKLAGRGAYLHARHTCWVEGLRGALERTLKTNFTPEELATLTKFMASLSEDDHQQDERDD